MKKVIGIALFLMVALTGYAQTTKLSVNFQFRNIVEGYDHDCKTQVLIDGEEVGMSAVSAQSKANSITVEVPAGDHELRIVNWALYEGTWEKHTIENDYSIDATYEEDHTFKKPEKLYLVFDIDNGTLASWKKPVKKK